MSLAQTLWLTCGFPVKTHEWCFSVFLVRVLLFSQMTSLMTILEDYFNWKGNIIACSTSMQITSFEPRKENIYLKINFTEQPPCTGMQLVESPLARKGINLCLEAKITSLARDMFTCISYKLERLCSGPSSPRLTLLCYQKLSSGRVC